MNTVLIALCLAFVLILGVFAFVLKVLLNHVNALVSDARSYERDAHDRMNLVIDSYSSRSGLPTEGRNSLRSEVRREDGLVEMSDGELIDPNAPAGLEKHAADLAKKAIAEQEFKRSRGEL